MDEDSLDNFKIILSFSENEYFKNKELIKVNKFFQVAYNVFLFLFILAIFFFKLGICCRCRWTT